MFITAAITQTILLLLGDKRDRREVYTMVYCFCSYNNTGLFEYGLVDC